MKIALVGRYVELHDAYISIVESLTHAGIAHGVNVEIDWIDSCEVTEENYEDKLKDADGSLFPAASEAEVSTAKSLRLSTQGKIKFRIWNLPRYAACRYRVCA